MRPNIDWETSQIQTSEDEVGFVDIRQEGQHPVHQMRGLPVPSEREGYQFLESLIVIEGVEGYQPFSKNLVRITSRRSLDNIQDLRGDFLRKDCYPLVELILRDCDTSDLEMSVRLCFARSLRGFEYLYLIYKNRRHLNP